MGGDDLEVRLTWLSDALEDSADHERPTLPPDIPVPDDGTLPGVVLLAEAVALMRAETAALQSALDERLDVLPDVVTNTREVLGLLDEVGAAATIHAGAHGALAVAVDDLKQRTVRMELGLTLLVDELEALRKLLAAWVGADDQGTAAVRAVKGAPRLSASGTPPPPAKKARVPPAKEVRSVRTGVRSRDTAPRRSGKASPVAPAKTSKRSPGDTPASGTTNEAPTGSGAGRTAPPPPGRAKPL